MMNNFTPRAQQVLALARKEADRFNHNYVGTEHLLLGLIKLGQGVAVNVLQKMSLDLETVRMEVEKQVGSGPETKTPGNIPYTPRVKKVLALAGKEAKALNHSYVGTEHILLGLLREGDGARRGYPGAPGGRRGPRVGATRGSRWRRVERWLRGGPRPDPRGHDLRCHGAAELKRDRLA